MIFLYILLGLVFTIGLIALIPLDLFFIYDEKFIIKLRVLFFSVILNKKKKNIKSNKKKTKVQNQKKAKNTSEIDSEQKKLTPRQLLDVLLKTSSELISSTRSHLKVCVNQIYLDVATPDPMQTSLLYAGVTGAVEVLMDYLEGNSRLKIKNVHVGVDFCKEKPTLKANIRFRLYVWQITKTFFCVAGAYSKTRLSYIQTEGNENEPS